MGASAETEFDMKELKERLQELTIVDFERDSAETESEHSSLRSLLTQFMECEGKSLLVHGSGLMVHGYDRFIIRRKTAIIY